jgi:DNA polymerase III delta prime subunit
VDGLNPRAEIFDVFMCHNSQDKPAVREVAQKLSEENIKPWLDEADIRSGTFWHTAIGQQIETVKSAAVFVGQHGLGPWQNREIIALLDQFDRRGCPVIPVILASNPPTAVVLPWSLVGLHCVDFSATDSQPLKRLIWGITSQKPAELSGVPTSEKPATMREASKGHLLWHRDEPLSSKRARAADPGTSEARLYPPLAEPPDQDQASQLKILRGRVMEYWVNGVLKHSLYNEAPISLGKRQFDKDVDAPWKYTVEVSDAMDSPPLDDRDVTVIYDATGLLLILGEPGSGKTTTLLNLAQALLERARDDLKERVPIILNLSSWKKKLPLAEWISGELSEKYRVPSKIARSWIQRDYLLLLLDGLDEIETVRQPDCVAAINSFIEEFKPPGLVVCCRLNEYRWLPKRLKLNGAICLEPLSSAEVSNYLTEGGPELAALREAVNTDSVLQELAQTPLMLTTMSLACQGVGGNELAAQKGNIEERRKQIFHLYVDRMFQKKGAASFVCPKERIIGWLSWLAGKMREHSQSVFLVEGLQPSWLGTRAGRVAYGTGVIVVVVLIVGLIVGLGAGLITGLSFGQSAGWIAGLIAGLSFGLMAGWMEAVGGTSFGLSFKLPGGLGAVPLNQIAVVETLGWRWNQFWKMTIPGLIIGLSVGLMNGLVLWPMNGVRVGLFVGMISGLSFGLFIMLCGGFTYRVKVDKESPNQGIKLSLKNSVVAFLVTSLVVSLIVGLIVELIGEQFSGQSSGQSGGGFAMDLAELRQLIGLIARHLTGLSVGLFGGLIVGLNRGGSAVIKHYTLRLILWLQGYTSIEFIRFLDQCAKLIFLKKVGCGYIFTHRMLLEYFAEMAPPSPYPEHLQMIRTNAAVGQGSLTAKPTSVAWKKGILGGVVLLFVILSPWCTKQLLERYQNAQIAGPATLQPFDERLSLFMPVAFGPVTEQTVAEPRSILQKTTTRNANFNGVMMNVNKSTFRPGTALPLEVLFSEWFEKEHPSEQLPHIDWSPANDVYESGSIRYPVTIEGKQFERTFVEIKSKTVDELWTILSTGRGDDAKVADQTARGFVFK